MASTSFVNMYIPKRKNFSLMDIMSCSWVLSWDLNIVNSISQERKKGEDC